MKVWLQKKDGKLWPYTVEDQDKVGRLPLDPIMVKYIQVRNPAHHRKYFAFIGAVYENLPEKYDEYWPTKRAFRKAMEMYAGYFEETVSLKGERHLQPKSIAYEELDEMAFSELHNKVKGVLGKHIIPYIDDIEQEVIVNEFY